MTKETGQGTGGSDGRSARTLDSLTLEQRIAHAFADTGDVDENRLRTAQHAPLIPRLIIEELVKEKRELARTLAAAQSELRGAEAEVQAWRAAHDNAEDLWQKELANRKALADALADIVSKGTDYGTQDGGFVAFYLLPTGPVHRAIPLLSRLGIEVRPGFDGRLPGSRPADGGERPR